MGTHAEILADGLATSHLRAMGVGVKTADRRDTPGEILDLYMPRLFVTGTELNTGTFGLALIEASRERNIPTVGIVDSPGHLHRRFRGGSSEPLFFMPDWIAVAGEGIKATFVQLGYPVDRIKVCANPHHDYVDAARQKFESEDRNILTRRVFPDAPHGRKIAVFATEGSERLYDYEVLKVNEYTLSGRGRFLGRTKVALEEFLDACSALETKPYLVLRLHPKDRAEDYCEVIDEFGLVGSGSLALELAYCADLVVSLTSAFLVEAVLLGTDVLSILPREKERRLLPAIDAGIVDYVTTREELRNALFCILGHGNARMQKSDLTATGPLKKIAQFLAELLECA